MLTDSGPRPLRILFVCSGNICRSPLAEAVFGHQATAAGVASRFVLDSAGTHGFHEGERADPRTRKIGARHGIEVTSLARPVRDSDFTEFDLILAMDRSHRRELLERSPASERHKIVMMRAYDRAGDDLDVPDPYYGGLEGFEHIYEMLSLCCRNLLASLLADVSTATRDADPA
jgi:protein-tyrosine phosphatase